MPEQLRPYLLPLVALLLIAVWFLFIQPRMTAPTASDPPEGSPDAKRRAE